ncbi:MAG: ATP-binding protein [Candidatus Binatia bacterium]
MSTVPKDREIGFVVAVTNTRVTVELHQEVKSAVRSYPGGLSTVAQIGAYLMFPLGAGEWAVGTIVGAFENESYEPEPSEGMTLQLAKPRRTLRVNLLGTVCTRLGHGDDAHGATRPHFRRGITVYPVLEAPAIIPAEDELQAILTDVVSWRMEEELPRTLHVGQSPIYPKVEVHADYDDLFSRPLAIVGNTGSGKSWTVASLLQRVLRAGDAPKARIIILDINGEYWKAFGQPQTRRRPDEAYVNGRAFGLPLWCMNLQELIHVFQVTEARQTQFPVLERMVTFARQFTALGEKARDVFAVRESIQRCRTHAQKLVDLSEGKGSQFKLGQVYCELAAAFQTAFSELKTHGALPVQPNPELETCVAGLVTSVQTQQNANALHPNEIRRVRDLRPPLIAYLDTADVSVVATCPVSGSTADAPYKFEPSLLDSREARSWVLLGFEGEGDIRKNLPTMFLRIRRTLADPRWRVMRSSQSATVDEVVRTIVGQSSDQSTNVTVIDCSMIAYDVLPFFCACIGRLLLDVRRHAAHDQRTLQPWVLVLEEAHNYLRPYRSDEELGVALSRESCERVAKEGRKFGLSLLIASQRPRDVSDTVLSQCANFIVHRIQNPEDIDYFRRIVPVGSREMLDQVPILAAGESLLLGSAVNVPSRVQIAKPEPAPSSDTPKPSKAWGSDQQEFDIQASVASWLRETSELGASNEEAPPNTDEGSRREFD